MSVRFYDVDLLFYDQQISICDGTLRMKHGPKFISPNAIKPKIDELTVILFG